MSGKSEHSHQLSHGQEEVGSLCWNDGTVKLNERREQRKFRDMNWDELVKENQSLSYPPTPTTGCGSKGINF